MNGMMKTVEQKCRDLLTVAIRDKLVELPSWGLSPENLSSGDLVGMANLLEEMLATAAATLTLSPAPAPATEPVLDFTVRVDRAAKPSYPSWLDKVMHPELEGTGPAEYDLSRDVEQRLHPDQLSGVKGNVIYKAFKRDNALDDQLGLSDLLAIQKMGIGVFRALFKGKSVFGWKSVVRDRVRDLRVPFLYGDGDEVVLGWSWLDLDCHSNNPALRFRK